MAEEKEEVGEASVHMHGSDQQLLRNDISNIYLLPRKWLMKGNYNTLSLRRN